MPLIIITQFSVNLDELSLISSTECLIDSSKVVVGRECHKLVMTETVFSSRLCLTVVTYLCLLVLLVEVRNLDIHLMICLHASAVSDLCMSGENILIENFSIYLSIVVPELPFSNWNCFSQPTVVYGWI
ncbi:hypothetical protein Tco_0428251 [Tanacetum coccineum]